VSPKIFKNLWLLWEVKENNIITQTDTMPGWTKWDGSTAPGEVDVFDGN
jgi:hypothetical protein